MMNLGKIKRAILGLACAGVPLVTTASCDPIHGFAHFRDDDDHGGFLDVIIEDDYYYDDCFFHVCFLDEFVIFD